METTSRNIPLATGLRYIGGPIMTIELPIGYPQFHFDSKSINIKCWQTVVIIINAKFFKFFATSSIVSAKIKKYIFENRSKVVLSGKSPLQKIH